MRSSTAVFLALGGIGSFAAGFWFARFPSSTTTHETSSPLAQHTRATSTATAQPVRCEIPLPAHPRDWRHLLTIIDPEEVPEVIDAALAIRDTDLRARVLSRLLEIWATEDPQAAFNWISRQKRPTWFDAHGFFRVWAERNPTDAVAHIAAIPDRFTRWCAAGGAAAAWADSNPTAALAWFRQLPESEVRAGALDGLCRHLAETDPQQAIAFALSSGNPTYLPNRLAGILRIQAAADPQAALATLNRLPPEIPRGPLCQVIADSLIAEEPLLAGEFALTIPPSEAQSMALQNVATRLSRDSLQTALDWINSSIPAGPVRNTVLRNTLIEATQVDPRSVAPLVTDLRSNLHLNVALNVALNWVRSDPQAAVAWVSQFPEGQNRVIVLNSVARSWAQSDPTAALSFALQQNNPQERTSMLQSIGGEWASVAPTEARTVLAQLPTDDARKSFLDGMVAQIGRRQPQTAAELVASLPAGDLHDSAARTYISNAASHDLRLASQVAHSIGNAATREDALVSIARIWLTKDRAATAAWLATAELPEATKQELLAPRP